MKCGSKAKIRFDLFAVGNTSDWWTNFMKRQSEHVKTRRSKSEHVEYEVIPKIRKKTPNFWAKLPKSEKKCGCSTFGEKKIWIWEIHKQQYRQNVISACRRHHRAAVILIKILIPFQSFSQPIMASSYAMRLVW